MHYVNYIGQLAVFLFQSVKLMTETHSLKYAFKESIDLQMQRLSALRDSDPVKATKLIEKGECLVEYCRQGQLRKLVIFTNVTENEDIIYFYVLKAVEVSLLCNHVMITDYFISNGFPIRDRSLPPLLANCLLQLTDDYLGETIVNFLAFKGYDLNIQVSLVMSSSS